MRITEHTAHDLLSSDFLAPIREVFAQAAPRAAALPGLGGRRRSATHSGSRGERFLYLHPTKGWRGATRSAGTNRRRRPLDMFAPGDSREGHERFERVMRGSWRPKGWRGR